MKAATNRIVDFFPNLEELLPSCDSTLLSNEALSELSATEQTFLRLAWFFENPDKENFNLENLYKTLQDDWLELALEVIDMFFKQDTFLIQNRTTSFVTDKSIFYNQSQFAELLTEHGLSYSRQKVNVYLARNKFPFPDLTIAGVKYWKRETAEQFLKEQKEPAEAGKTNKITMNDKNSYFESMQQAKENRRKKGIQGNINNSPTKVEYKRTKQTNLYKYNKD